MKNQTIQYDSGKYYYIEDCPNKSHYIIDDDGIERYWAKIKSTRIEVAPESVKLAEKLFMREQYGKWLVGKNCIFSVQVKVKIVKRKYFDESMETSVEKKYVILSEPDKDLLVTVK